MTLIGGEERLFIEDFFPALIGGKGVLSERLSIAARTHGLSHDDAEDLLSKVPLCLWGIGCFLDKATNLWRYELGKGPHELASGKQFWSADDMWPRVDALMRVLRCACHRLDLAERRRYFARLVAPDHHAAAIAEFAPAVRLSNATRARYEQRTGAGNRTVDWLIEPSGEPPVWCEVKRRDCDLIEHADAIAASTVRGYVPAPAHDPADIFRSIEEKFPENDPAISLQGAWIVAGIQQPRDRVQAAFAGLNPTKVHYAIIGNWEPGVLVLARRPQDREKLLTLFGETHSERHAFDEPP